VFNDQQVEAVSGVTYRQWVATSYAGRKGHMEVR
jgi:hypothetical protein